MKNFTNFILSILFCLTLSGCIQSLHPFYTEDLLVTKPELDGNWKGVHPDDTDFILDEDTKPLVIEGDLMEIYDEDGNLAEFEIHFFKLNGHLFADIMAGEDSETTSPIWALYVIPVHSVYKIEINDGLMAILPLNYGWVKAKRETKEITLSFLRTQLESEYSPILINSTTEQLVAFLKEHGNNAEAFSKEDKTVLKKLSE